MTGVDTSEYGHGDTAWVMHYRKEGGGIGENRRHGRADRL